jgi:uncharacterized integral membrane protein
MKIPMFLALLLIVILVAVFYVYYRPTVEVAWFGRTVSFD